MPWVIVKPKGEVVAAHCRCMAGHELYMIHPRNHLLPSEDKLSSELVRWRAHCSEFHTTLKIKNKLITHLLCEDADPIIFLNIREPAFLHISNTCPLGALRQKGHFMLKTELRTTMLDDRL